MIFNIVKYSQGDEVKIVELLKSVFKDWPKFDINYSALEHWKWKYLDNPYSKILIVLAKNEEELIGCHHDVPIKIIINKELYDCSYTADLAVSNNYRELGVSNGMRDYKEKYVKINEFLSYFVTSNPKLIKSFSQIFNKLPCKIKNYFYMNNPDKYFENNPVKISFIIKSTIKLIRAWNRLKKIKSKKSLNKVTITKVLKFDSSFDDFLIKTGRDYDFMIYRSRDYLNWRYCDKRAGNFQIYSAKGAEGETLGIIVLIINNYDPNNPVGFISEIITIDKRIDVADALIKEGKKFFFENDVNLVTYLIPENHPYEGVIKKQGFIYSRVNINLFYQQFKEPKISELFGSKLPEIFFSWGDLDVRPSQIPSSSIFSYLFK